MKKNNSLGHLAALLTIAIWATTFVSTKVLLTAFAPLEILLLRFIIGFAALVLACPRPLHVQEKTHEIYFALAGLCGICIYYLLENIALSYTQASNVGVIISVAPFFTGLLAPLLLKEDSAHNAGFFAGFALAMAGIALLSFEGRALQFNPRGDLLALLAAVVWAFYSILSRKIAGFGYNVIQATRRTFAYGIAFMLPVTAFFGVQWDFARFAVPAYLLNILYLGVGASALCFVTWNFAVKTLGAVKTSLYIYLVPVITVLASVLILQEKITALSAVGIALTVGGLVVSQGKIHRREGR